MKKKEWEHQQQSALFDWAGFALQQYPQLEWLHAVPNGSDRHPVVAGKLKKEGTKAGVVDVFLDIPNKAFHGWRCEMKVVYPDGSKNYPSDDQIKWIEHYRKHDYFCDVFYSWETARDSLTQYLNNQLSNENYTYQIKKRKANHKMDPEPKRAVFDRQAKHLENQNKIIDFLTRFPNQTASNIAKNCNLKLSFIYTTLNNMTQEKRTRPALITKFSPEKPSKKNPPTYSIIL